MSVKDQFETILEYLEGFNDYLDEIESTLPKIEAFGAENLTLDGTLPALYIVPDTSTFEDTVPRHLKWEMRCNLIIAHGNIGALTITNLEYLDALRGYLTKDQSLGGATFYSRLVDAEFFISDNIGLIEAVLEFSGME